MFGGTIFRAVAGAMIAGAALSGCAVYHTEVEGGYSAVALAALSGGIPLQVDGIVGGQSGAPLATAVAANMPSSVDGTSVHYAPCEPYAECAGDHIVWTFGPPAARPSSVYPAAFHINLDWIGAHRPSPNNVTAKVALFQGGNVVASASGQVDAPDGSNDPAFRALVNEMSRAILSHSILDAF